MAREFRRGWRIRLLVELQSGPSWRLLPPIDSGDSFTYARARQLAEQHANEGRRVRIVDPEGRDSEDVPAQKRPTGPLWRLPM
jgi:hypothetical protein